MKTIAICAGIGGFLGVAFGAFGAHAIRDYVDPHLLSVWQTAVQYHLFHCLVLLVVVAMAVQQPDNRSLRVAGGLFVAGTVLFSGSLYGLVLSGIKLLGMVTPIGGVLLLAGWLVLSFGLVKFVASGRSMAERVVGE